MAINLSYGTAPRFGKSLNTIQTPGNPMPTASSLAPNGTLPAQPKGLSEKQLENFAVVHDTFKKTAPLAAPNATPAEREAWVNAGDKAMADSVKVFHSTFDKTHNKELAQMATSKFAAAAFLPNLLATEDGRHFLIKASQNNTRQQNKSV